MGLMFQIEAWTFNRLIIDFFFFTKYCRVIIKAVNFLVCTVKVGFPLMNW